VSDRSGNNDLVAHVLVDLAVLVGDRIGDQGKNGVEKAVDGNRANLLGDTSGSHDIGKKKEALLHAWLVIAAQQEVAQGAAA